MNPSILGNFIDAIIGGVVVVFISYALNIHGWRKKRSEEEKETVEEKVEEHENLLKGNGTDINPGLIKTVEQIDNKIKDMKDTQEEQGEDIKEIKESISDLKENR